MRKNEAFGQTCCATDMIATAMAVTTTPLPEENDENIDMNIQ